MKVKLLIGLVVLSINNIGFANFNDDIWALSNQSKKILKQVDQGLIQSIKSNSYKQKDKFSDFINNLKSKQVKSSSVGGKTADGAILFVSFSMPIELIEELIEEATVYHIPIVIKGLIQGDFKSTIETIGKLKLAMEKEDKSFSGILINPVWFQTFNIQKVPALVVTERPEGCETQDKCLSQKFDVVYGNISIKKGLQIISERGEHASHVAKRYVEGLKND